MSKLSKKFSRLACAYSAIFLALFLTSAFRSPPLLANTEEIKTFQTKNKTNDSSSLEALPNILIIVSDDQNSGMVKAAMPFTYNEIFKKGLNYKNFYIARLLCCPSRAGLFTGLYPERNGVTGNKKKLKVPAKLFTRAKKLNYQVGVFGKYLNSHRGDPPAFADYWAVLRKGSQKKKRFKLNVNGKLKGYSPPT